MMNESPPLFERLGGAKAIRVLIEDFYSRVTGDPELAPFFEQVDLQRLRHMQQEFFSAALDGPMQTSDLDLAYVHHGRGITVSHFNRFVQHLLQTLSEQGVNEHDRMEVIRRISTYVDDITGEVGANGD